MITITVESSNGNRYTKTFQADSFQVCDDKTLQPGTVQKYPDRHPAWLMFPVVSGQAVADARVRPGSDTFKLLILYIQHIDNKY